MKVKKTFAFIGIAGLLLAVFVSCGNGTTSDTITEGSIQGVWEVKKGDGKTYPINPEDEETAPDAKEWLYFCFDKGTLIIAKRITGMPNSSENGLFRSKPGTYEILAGNSIKMTYENWSTIVPFTLNGDTLIAPALEARRTGSPTVQEIRDAQDG